MPHFYHNSISLIDLSVINNSLSVTFNWRLLVLLAIIIVIYFIFRRSRGQSFGSDFEIDKTEVGIGSGKISFKPNREDQQIAYAIWVELSTRKIGIPIDLEHDVIYEIYDSWYNFFSITRELIKNIPVNKVKKASTQEIINLSIEVLNQGMRPHLTSWQARFRHWYDRQLTTVTIDTEPQLIQKDYHKFQELKSDLLIVNNRLIKYREKMHELVFGLKK